MSTTIFVVGRSPVADLVLDHHRANFRPRVAVEAPPPQPVVPSRDCSARPITAFISPGAAVTQVLLIRLIACLVLWVAAGTVYGFWQLGNVLVPPNQHGVVTCGTTHGLGSIPGC